MTSVFREEKKYLLDLKHYYHVRHNIQKIMMRDKYSVNNPFEGKKGEGYTIRSLYFDSLDDRDFHEKEDGVELRRKLRLRTYMHDTNYCLLELKKKQGNYQQKTSYKLTKAEGERLISGDYSLLLEKQAPFLLECYEMMMTHVYRPKSIVTYERDAYIAKENQIRVTFDQKIRGSESTMALFDERLIETPLIEDAYVVLEVKYNGFLLQYIKDLLIPLEEAQLSVSKYSMSRQISKHYKL